MWCDWWWRERVNQEKQIGRSPNTITRRPSLPTIDANRKLKRRREKERERENVCTPEFVDLSRTLYCWLPAQAHTHTRTQGKSDHHSSNLPLLAQYQYSIEQGHPKIDQNSLVRYERARAKAHSLSTLNNFRFCLKLSSPFFLCYQCYRFPFEMYTIL